MLRQLTARTALFVLASLFVAVPALANEFVPLAPIPDLDTGEGATLSSYLNSVFRLAISIGGILAVLMIVKSGFLYMTSEAINQKGTARTELQNAIFGLILLLMSYLILEIINPTILTIDPFASFEQSEGPRERTSTGPVETVPIPAEDIPPNYPGGRPTRD